MILVDSPHDLARQPDEDDYRERYPPEGEYFVDDRSNPDIASVLLSQLPGIPVRWRSDMFFGLVQLLAEHDELRRRRRRWRRLLTAPTRLWQRPVGE